MFKSGQPIETTGNNLVGLWRPSFVKTDHRLFVYGGGGNVTNDLHVLNLCDMRWETIQVRDSLHYNVIEALNNTCHFIECKR
jgi:hypothetical protein